MTARDVTRNGPENRSCTAGSAGTRLVVWGQNRVLPASRQRPGSWPATPWRTADMSNVDRASTPGHIKARPTVYNGIKMRSRLEAGYAAWLDRHHFAWEYEPCAFSTDGGAQYLPDFRLDDVHVLGRPTPCTVYVEVKPENFGGAEDEYTDERTSTAGQVPPLRGRADDEEWKQLLKSMAGIWASEPEAVLVLDQPEIGTSILCPDMRIRMVWAFSAEWCFIEEGQPFGLARPVGPAAQPWHGQWWKGQP